MNKLKQTGLALLGASMLGLSSCNIQNQYTYQEFFDTCGNLGEKQLDKTHFMWAKNDTIFLLDVVDKAGWNKYKGVMFVDNKPFGSIDKCYGVTLRGRDIPYKRTISVEVEIPDKNGTSDRVGRTLEVLTKTERMQR